MTPPKPNASTPIVDTPTFTVEQLKTDREAVTEAARQPGGCRIIGSSGSSFVLSIPGPLPIDDVRADWISLTDEQRLELLSLCCTHCGTTQLPCYCAPAYDE